MRKIITAVVLSTSFVLGLSIAPSTAAQVKPTLTVLDSEVHVGESIPVTGSGYSRYSTIAVAWYLSEASYGLTAFVNPDGTFNVSLPASGLPGVYTIKVTPLGKTHAISSTEIEVLP